MGLVEEIENYQERKYNTHFQSISFASFMFSLFIFSKKLHESRRDANLLFYYTYDAMFTSIGVDCGESAATFSDRSYSVSR